MHIREETNRYLIEKVFPQKLIAGFTKKNLKGDLPEEIIEIYPNYPSGKTAFLDQKHSEKIVYTDRPGIYTGDGIFSSKVGICIRTADCLPIFFLDKKTGAYGLLHMGWRSAKKGILEKLPEDLEPFTVLAGPGMRKCCYEVGEEFLKYAEFRKHIEERGQSLFFDPIGFLKEALFRRGVKKEQLYDSGICSICSGKDIFSYRKEKTKNRTVSFVFKKEAWGEVT